MLGDVAEDATAFSNRGYQLWLNFAMRWDDPARDAGYMARTRRAVSDLPIEAQIARGFVPHLRLSGIEGVRGLD